jgi:hypothetical protein
LAISGESSEPVARADDPLGQDPRVPMAGSEGPSVAQRRSYTLGVGEGELLMTCATLLASGRLWASCTCPIRDCMVSEKNRRSSETAELLEKYYQGHTGTECDCERCKGKAGLAARIESEQIPFSMTGSPASLRTLGSDLEPMGAGRARSAAGNSASPGRRLGKSWRVGPGGAAQKRSFPSVPRSRSIPGRSLDPSDSAPLPLGIRTALASLSRAGRWRAGTRREAPGQFARSRAGADGEEQRK